MKHSSIAFLVHKSLSDHQFWVHQEVLRKFNMSSSYWLRIRSERQKFRRAFRGFSSQLMRQKLGLILHSHHLTWKLNCWNRMLSKPTYLSSLQSYSTPPSLCCPSLPRHPVSSPCPAPVHTLPLFTIFMLKIILLKRLWCSNPGSFKFEYSFAGIFPWLVFLFCSGWFSCLRLANQLQLCLHTYTFEVKALFRKQLPQCHQLLSTDRTLIWCHRWPIPPWPFFNSSADLTASNSPKRWF